MLFLSSHLYVSPGLILENYAVQIRSGIIQSLVPKHRLSLHRSPHEKVYDMGEGVLLPGFANGHTHLWLTHLKGFYPQPKHFTDWVQRLRHHFLSWKVSDYRSSMRSGLQASYEAGVFYLVDYTRIPALFSVRHPHVTTIKLLELLGGWDRPALRQFQEEMEEAMNRVSPANQDKAFPPLVGLAPHAPYSVSPQAYRWAAQICGKKNLVLSTHAAELKEEVALLHKGSRQLLRRAQKYGITHYSADDFPVPGERPIFYLDRLGLLRLPKVLLSHGNYLSREEIQLLSQRQPLVIYCPRSSAYFGHVHHPLEKLLKARVPVALGTDSLASNETLSIFDEMRFLHRCYPRVAPRDIFQMAYENIAPIFDFVKMGRIYPGYAGKLVLVRMKGLSLKKKILENLLERDFTLHPLQSG